MYRLPFTYERIGEGSRFYVIKEDVHIWLHHNSLPITLHDWNIGKCPSVEGEGEEEKFENRVNNDLLQKAKSCQSDRRLTS